jgi:poly(A) polymerase
LFHGGQAVKSLELLREIGLFKLMFTFTSEYLVEGELSLPERALANTDKRIQIGKRVIPAFLFSCLLWDPVQEDAHRLMDQGNTASKAWRIAMMDALRDQSQYVSVPRRMADTVIEIWTLHFRLISRKPNSIFQLMSDRRFRAAYDFMLLRSSLSEVDSDLADWWTDIQELDEVAKQKMVEELTVSQESDDGEPNFNSVEYQHKNEQSFNNKPNGKNNRGRHQHGRGKPGASNKPHAKNGRRRNTQRRKPSGPSAVNKPSQGSPQGNNQGNSANSNDSGGQVKQQTNKPARSNPYRSRRKKVNKVKKEDSYF